NTGWQVGVDAAGDAGQGAALLRGEQRRRRGERTRGPAPGRRGVAAAAALRRGFAMCVSTRSFFAVCVLGLCASSGPGGDNANPYLAANGRLKHPLQML